MAYSAVPTVVTGDLWSAANHNTYLRDNLAALWPFTTAGDIAVASSATALARLAVGSHIGDLLRVNAAGNAPEWGGLVGAFGRDASTGSVNNNVSVDITFDSEKYDSHNFVDLVGQPKRITIPSGMGGIYLVLTSANFGSSSASTGISELCTYHTDSGNTIIKTQSLLRHITHNDFRTDSSTTMMVISAVATDYIYAIFSNYLGVNGASASDINIGVIRLMGS